MLHATSAPNAVQQMTLHSFKHVIKIRSETKGAKRTAICAFHWIVPRRDGRWYCPLCFAHDRTPYLRLFWRLRIAPICVSHNVLLASECGHCHNQLDPFDENPTFDIGKCARCGFPLANTVTKAVNPNDLGYVAVKGLLKSLNCRRIPRQCLFDGTVADLFDALRFVILSLGAMANFDNYPKEVCDPRLFYDLLGQAWGVLNDSAELEQLVDLTHHQHIDGSQCVGRTSYPTLFNYLTHNGYTHRIPKFLRKFELSSYLISSNLPCLSDHRKPLTMNV